MPGFFSLKNSYIKSYQIIFQIKSRSCRSSSLLSICHASCLKEEKNKDKKVEKKTHSCSFCQAASELRRFLLPLTILSNMQVVLVTKKLLTANLRSENHDRGRPFWIQVVSRSFPSVPYLTKVPSGGILISSQCQVLRWTLEFLSRKDFQKLFRSQQKTTHG